MAGAQTRNPGGNHTASQIAQRAANLDRVRVLIAVRPMTTAELAEIIDVPKATVNGYLYHLQDLGEARSIPGAGKRSHMWVADEQSQTLAKERALQEHASRVRVVKAQQVGMVRHWMDVALFGPAQGAAA